MRSYIPKLHHAKTAIGVEVRKWMVWNMTHRDGGPAIELSTGYKEWWQGGERILHEQGNYSRGDCPFPGYGDME